MVLGVPTPALGQIEFEREPINYNSAPASEPVAKLQQLLDTGQAALQYDPQHGYLPSVLTHLGVDASSQILVFSKTSFQPRQISPQRPRALYFNDASHVGWVQGGDVLELMTTDPQLGEVFYTLSQHETAQPRFVRDRGACIACHASSRTQGVPGGLVRSVFVGPSGQPEFSFGTFNIDHRSPFDDRWGGWYVTGSHGKMRHMGNVVLAVGTGADALDREAGANVTDLSIHLDVSAYLTPHSDIVALMVLEHQTQMQNFMTLANYDARSAAHYDRVMNKALDRPADFVSDATKRRAASVGEKLVRYMLFADEFPLTAPVEGSSSFAEQFQSRGPRDSHGRSLRDFDLTKRMFKYPCSYLIYSPSFDALPGGVKSYVAVRLDEVLTSQDDGDQFAHISQQDRQAIREILLETKPHLWNQ